MIATTTSTQPATEAQVRFIERLLDQRDVPAQVRSNWESTKDQVDKRFASRVIDYLKTFPVRQETETEQAEALEPGMYRMDGTIYKVKASKVGHLYAQELHRAGRSVWYEYAKGVIRRLRPEHRMTLEQAKEFGALVGSCCVCARTLTNPASVAAGIGPICASRI